MPTQLSPPPSNRSLRHALPKYRHAFCLIREAYQGEDNASPSVHTRAAHTSTQARIMREFLTAPCEREIPSSPTRHNAELRRLIRRWEGGNEGLMMPHKWRVQ